MEDFKAWPVYRIQPVKWGEMDAMGHVNNCTYIRWFEDARIELFDKMGFPARPDGANAAPILGNLDCRYRIPLEYPDIIETLCGIREIREYDLIVDHVILSQQHQAVAATGSSRIVMIDYSTGQKVEITGDMRKQFEELMLPPGDGS